MKITNNFILCAFFLFFLPGCAYITHLDEAMFVKNLDDNQKQMQAQLAKEARLYKKLRGDIDNQRLKQLTQKRVVFSRYGKPPLCRPAEGQERIKETCIYRMPSGGLFTEIILLDFDSQDKLLSWQIQGSK